MTLRYLIFKAYSASSKVDIEIVYDKIKVLIANGEETVKRVIAREA